MVVKQCQDGNLITASQAHSFIFRKLKKNCVTVECEHKVDKCMYKCQKRHFKLTCKCGEPGTVV